MAKTSTTANGGGRLEEAMAVLIQNQAAFLSRMLEMDRASSERFSRIEQDMSAILRVLAEHSRLLERLPEAVREKSARWPGTPSRPRPWVRGARAPPLRRESRTGTPRSSRRRAAARSVATHSRSPRAAWAKNRPQRAAFPDQGPFREMGKAWMVLRDAILFAGISSGTRPPLAPYGAGGVATTTRRGMLESW